MEVLQPVAQTK
jgi:hypothetical protein